MDEQDGETFSCIVCLERFDSKESVFDHEIQTHFQWAAKPFSPNLSEKLVDVIKSKEFDCQCDQCRLKKRLMAILREYQSAYDEPVGCLECEFEGETPVALVGHFKVAHIFATEDEQSLEEDDLMTEDESIPEERQSSEEEGLMDEDDDPGMADDQLSLEGGLPFEDNDGMREVDKGSASADLSLAKRARYESSGGGEEDKDGDGEREMPDDLIKAGDDYDRVSIVETGDKDNPDKTGGDTEPLDDEEKDDCDNDNPDKTESDIGSMDDEEKALDEADFERGRTKKNNQEKEKHCLHCGESFSNMSMLQVQDHVQKNHYSDLKCNHCDFQSKSWKQLVAHLEKSHGRNCDGSARFRCQHCGSTYATQALLNAHVRKMCLRCSHCGFEAGSKEQLNDHLGKQHNLSPSFGDLNFYCDICDMQLKNLKSFRSHQRRVHEGKLQCQQCPHQAPNRADLQVHMVEEHNQHVRGTKSCHKCNHCGQQFVSIARLETHLILTHFRENRCNLCEFQSKRSTRKLKSHMMEVHKMTLCGHEGHPCGRCHKIFASKNAAVTHAKRHHPGDSRFLKEEGKASLSVSCDVCGTAFKDKYELDKHTTAKHSSKHRCNKCSKFATGCPKELERHLLNWHTEFCSDCSLPIDSSERNKKSSGHHCPAAFGPGPIPDRGDDNAGSRIRTYGTNVLTLESGFACLVCGFRSDRKITAQRHDQLMHKPQDCPATGCQKTLPNRTLLLSHLREIHDDVCPTCAYVGEKVHSCEREVFFREANPMLSCFSSNTKPIACRGCERLYHNASHLARCCCE